MTSRLLLRAPMMTSPDDVVEYLAARGCDRITVHAGPDGSYRGCGEIAQRDEQEAAE